MKKVLRITALVLVVSILTAGITVFAGGFKKGVYPKDLTEEQKALVVERLTACLNEMADGGEITVEQAEAIAKSIEGGRKGRMNMGERKVFEKKKMPEFTEEQKAEMIEKQKERLSERLEKGEITQQQYDEMIEKMENGEFVPMGRGPRGNGPEGKGPRGERPQGEFKGKGERPNMPEKAE